MKKLKYVFILLLCFFLFSCDKKETGLTAKDNYKNELKEFEKKQTDSFTVQMDAKFHNLEEETDDLNFNFKLKTELISYLEFWDNLNDQLIIFQSEKGNLFQYELNQESTALQAKKTYVGLNEGFLGFQYAKIAQKLYVLDPKNPQITATQKNDIFTFKGPFQNFLTKDEKEVLNSLFHNLEELEYLYTSPCKVETKFDDNQALVAWHMDVKNGKNKKVMTMDLSFDLSFGSFEKIKLNEYQLTNTLPEEKENVVKELSKKLESFFEDEWKSYSINTHLEVAMKTKEGAIIATESTNEVVHISLNPLYIEVTNPSKNEKVVIQEEKKKIFQYTIDLSREGIQEVEKEYLGPLDSFENPYCDFLKSDSLYLFPLNADSLRSASKETSDTYQLDCVLEEMISDEELNEIFEGAEQYAKEIKKSYFTSQVVVGNTYIQEEFLTEFLISRNGEIYPVQIRIKNIITRANFEKENMKDTTKYYIPGPTSMDEVTELTEVDKDIVLEYHNTFYAFELTEGYYAITAPTEHDLYLLSHGLALYDANQQQLPMGIGIQSSSYYFTQVVFHIDEPGTYYLFMGGGGSYVTCQVTRLPYQNSHYKDNPLNIQNSIGSIDGRFDFKCYLYEAAEECIIKLTNPNETPLRMLVYTEVTYHRWDYIIVEDYTYIHMNEGVNYFYICSDPDQKNYAYEYEFTVSPLGINNVSSLDITELPVLTNTYSILPYFAGLGYTKNAQFIFEVQEKGKYRFDTKFIEKSEYSSFNFIVKDMEGLPLYIYDGYEFDIGKYIIEIDMDPRFYGIGYVKYTKVE